MPYENLNKGEFTSEILGKMPSWTIRWGLTLVFLIFLGILFGCYFIKYPEIVTVPVTITTVNPPSDVISYSEGRIDSLHFKEGEHVSRGDIIAVLENTADCNSVLMVEKLLRSSHNLNFEKIVYQQWVDHELVFGELQSAYADFRKSSLDYRHYLTRDYSLLRTTHLQQQIQKNREYLEKQRLQYKLLMDDLDIETKNVRRDSLLCHQKVISASEFENSSRVLLDKQRSAAGFEATLIMGELNIVQLESQLSDISFQRQSETAEYERTLGQKRESLLAQIEQWKRQYILTAPIDGVITYMNYWSTNQRISAGNRLASIVPEEEMMVIGRITVPSSGLGKVETGQQVNVKLNAFPYTEYGILKGVITFMAAVPDENGYNAEVGFPDGLYTTYNKDIYLIHEMDGIGEIITDNLRLIERFLQPLRALFDNK